MKNWIKHHISKTVVKNAKRGKKNFWWYEGIHKKSGIGWKYHFNKTFTIVYAVTFGVHVLLGWIKIISFFVMIGSFTVYIMAAVMLLYWTIQSNLEDHGSPFVLFARSSNGGIDSVLIDILSVMPPMICGFAQLILFLNAHNINE